MSLLEPPNWTPAFGNDLTSIVDSPSIILSEETNEITFPERISVFLFFLKRLIMQPSVRRFFIEQKGFE